jgi:Zn-dependent protease with chaperone function
MLNNIVKGFRIYKNYIINIANHDQLLNITIFDKNEEGYAMKQNSQHVAKSKCHIAVCTKVTFINGYTMPAIITDGFFRMLSEDTQQFIIHHELGHYNLQPEIFEQQTTRNDANEFEADEYSMNIVGKEIAIKGLEEIKDLLIGINFGLKPAAVKEIDRRIENLMNK